MMNESHEKVIRVGSRKSELALIQTKHVIREVQKLYPDKKFEIHTMSTIGDRILNISLPKIGEKSLFTRDLEDALKHGRIDFIVHSLKDLPTALPSGMTIGAVLEREDSRDALVLNKKYEGCTLQTLPESSVIGTSSLRRTAQIRRKFPHLVLCDIRGNLNTRLAKLDAFSSKFAGIILAQAGLARMGWENRVSQILEPDDLLYCVGQGALAVECRANDEYVLSMLKNLMCLSTTCKILAERSFLKTLGGGCSAPVAVSSYLNKTISDSNKCINGSTLSLSGAVWSLNGETEISSNIKCSLELGKRRKTEEYSTTEDEDDEDESPKKRFRIDESPDKESEKRSSPKIVNDDSDLQSMGNEISNLQHLIKVHGQKCPFYTLHTKEENGTTSSNKDECHLKVPIGQDFMGLCPFVNTDSKVELSENGECSVPRIQDFMTQCRYFNTDSKCEFSEKNVCSISDNKLISLKSLPENINFEMTDQKTMSESQAGNNNSQMNNKNQDTLKELKSGEKTNLFKCPFSEKNINIGVDQNCNNSGFCEKDGNLLKKTEFLGSPQKSLSSFLDKNENANLLNSGVGHESCPFLQKVKLIDYSDEGKSNEIIERSLSPEISENECKDMFCGIFRHKCFDKFIFKKCDELGRQLAHNLINKGALNIMKLAQNEIHQSITK